MVKAVDSGAASAAQPLPHYVRDDMADERDAPQIMEQVATAFARLRRDLDTYHPNKPALAYALAGETHTVMLQRWRQYPPPAQAALLTAFLDETSSLLHQLQARIARIAPSNGYMYGLQDEAIKLETQADITLEEIRRIEAELRLLETGEPLQ
jgi:hypothetical protein